MRGDLLPDLLEREEQLATLVAAVEQAARGGGGTLALVTGEAGAGKSALVRALEAAVAPRRVATGWCDLLATPRPMGPLLDIARSEQLAIDLDAGIAEVGALLLDHLAPASAPVLVVEDLHWADAATLDLVRYVARRITTTRGVVVVTCRTDELGPDHPARAVIGDLVPLPGVERVPVPLFSPAATAMLVEGTDLDTDRVHAITGGNPFFVTEIVALGTLRPATVAAAVMTRLARLDADARAVTEVVALSPRALEIGPAIAVAGTDLAALDRSLVSGVLVELDDRVGFRHELARAAVEASLPAGRRRDGHRRLLEALEVCASDDLPRLVHHALRADDWQAVRRFAPAAGEQALRRGAPWQAVSFLEAALDALGGDDPVRSVELRLTLCDALNGLDRVREQFEHADRATAEARVLADPARSALLARALAMRALTSSWCDGCPSDPQADIDEAVDLVDGLTDERASTQVLLVGAWVTLQAQQRPATEAYLARLAPLVERLGDTRWRHAYARARGYADLVFGDVDRGVRALQAVIDAAAADWLTVVLTAGVLGSGAREVRRYDLADAALVRTIDAAGQFDAHGWTRLARADQASVAMATGRLEEAVTTGRLVADRAREPAIRAVALGAAGRALVRGGGAEDEAAALLQDAVAAGRSCGLGFSVSPTCGLVELGWTRGDLTSPPERLRELYACALRSDSPWSRGEAAWWMWRLGALEAPPPLCAEPYALQISGHWREAAAAWREIGAPWEEAMALADGGPDDRLAALQLLDGIGASATADLVRSWLRRDDDVAVVPRGPQHATRENPAGLTPRQLEVLELVVAGLDNATIAARLHLSKRTVEHHVGAIFTKLHVHSRNDAVAAAETLGIGG